MTSISTSPLAALRLIASDIKIAHSVFALPFALLAAFMAALGPTGGTWSVGSGSDPDLIPDLTHPFLLPENSSIFWQQFRGQLILIVLAMVFARTIAMLANRILDRDLDAENPRTSGRALPSGKLSLKAMVGTLIFSTILFMLTCVAFGIFYTNWWPAILSLPVLIWISSYALLKRFTVLCHIYLGSSLALSPLAAAIAIQPESVMQQPALWLLAGMVLCWVAGFDIIYALQDLEADLKQGLHSIPSKFGVSMAMWISRGLHLIASACLIAVWWIDPRLELLFAIGTGLVIAVLIFEHATVHRWGTTKIALTFFTLNGIIACLLGTLGIMDVIL